MKAILREAVCRTADCIYSALGYRDPLIPPARLRVRVGCFGSYVRIGRYRAVATEFTGHLSKLAGLTSTTRMLDIGCGCGQIAAELTRLLGPEGSYDGFDPDPEAISWCRSHIASRFHQFRFEEFDLANTLYNPRGRIRAENFRFPYPDGAFDLILLKSVFTHLSHNSMAHYLKEIRRMLVPGAVCLATFLLMNETAHLCMRAGKSVYTFGYSSGGSWVLDRNTPDYVVAHDETLMRTAAQRAGLKICEPVYYGAWCGRSDYVSFQDMVLFRREAEAHE